MERSGSNETGGGRTPMEVIVGGNTTRNCSVILMVGGKPQISLEIGDNDSQLLLTMDVYDAEQTHIAKLKRNAWVFHHRDLYEIKTNLNNLELVTKRGSTTLFRAKVDSKRLVSIEQIDCFTSNGQRLKGNQTELTIDGISIAGNEIEGCGVAIVI